MKIPEPQQKSPTSPQPQLSDEQRQMLRAAAVADARRMVANRAELQAKSATMRQIWQAMLQAPSWSIVHGDKPADAPSFDEVWSMKPTVNKQ